MKAGKAPSFWWAPPSPRSRLLGPAAFVYGAVARRKLIRGERARVGVPVLCVGNYTVGGGGKTPTAMALGTAARAAGLSPGFVTRGHGRAAGGAVLVDVGEHTVFEVGDEPLLLASVAPTSVCVDRRKAVDLLVSKRSVDFVIMDDGFQSARLFIDYALIAVDARRGFGNAKVLPAGPLRAPLADQLHRTDALVVVGEGAAAEGAVRLAARSNLPVFGAVLQTPDDGSMRGANVLAFAGIADPSKFYAHLQGLGANVAATLDFPDHHMFTKQDMDGLSAAAWKQGLQLATTRKDAVRLATGGRATKLFLTECEVLDVEMRFDPADAPARIIRDTLAAFGRRRAGIPLR